MTALTDLYKLIDKQSASLPFSKADEFIIREFHQQWPKEPSKRKIVNFTAREKERELMIRFFHHMNER